VLLLVILVLLLPVDVVTLLRYLGCDLSGSACPGCGFWQGVACWLSAELVQLLRFCLENKSTNADFLFKQGGGVSTMRAILLRKPGHNSSLLLQGVQLHTVSVVVSRLVLMMSSCELALLFCSLSLVGCKACTAAWRCGVAAWTCLPDCTQTAAAAAAAAAAARLTCLVLMAASRTFGCSGAA
jgi:hypothetical protein